RVLQAEEIVLRPRDGTRERVRRRRDAGAGGAAAANRGHLSATATAAPVLWPRPAETPSNGSTAPFTGLGRGPKLKRRFFQRSPLCAFKPRLAVGSYPQCTMQFSQRGSRASPSITPYLSQSVFSRSSR